MPPQEFVKWKQKVLLGVSLKVMAPTGQYAPTKLINWGSRFVSCRVASPCVLECQQVSLS